MKNFKLIAAIVLFISLASCNDGGAQPGDIRLRDPRTTTDTTRATKIQVAILLDASNSMDGLIDQAKSRLWNIVNTLTTLRFNGKEPSLEIALYMYGNDGILAKDNYVRQLTPFTTDLDLISEKLFSITTNGGSEYCGAVIEQAVKKLDWGREPAGMRLIYIAGNEPFNQGGISYAEAISSATAKDIYINTIFCGDRNEGITTHWKDGADRGKGEYFSINSNAKVVYVVTPYDERIRVCNESLNKTYIYYGEEGSMKYENQAVQDYNASSVSQANMAERVVSKSKSQYNNTSWDLVDKTKQDSTYIAKVDKKNLPTEYKNLTTVELEQEVKAKTEERNKLQKEINELSVKRQEYINSQTSNTAVADDLGAAINVSIMNLAKIKGYTKN